MKNSEKYLFQCTSVSMYVKLVTSDLKMKLYADFCQKVQRKYVYVFFSPRFEQKLVFIIKGYKFMLILILLILTLSIERFKI